MHFCHYRINCSLDGSCAAHVTQKRPNYASPLGFEAPGFPITPSSMQMTVIHQKHLGFLRTQTRDGRAATEPLIGPQSADYSPEPLAAGNGLVS